MERKIDSDAQRATYGVAYPQQKIELVDKKSNAPLVIGGNNRFFASNSDIEFKDHFATWKRIDFTECRFYYAKGKENVLIENATFRECTFKSCFMGSCNFKHVRFQNCSFKACDFMNAVFENCSFKDCSFEGCSARYTRIVGTELSAKKFFSGLAFLKENFKSNQNIDAEFEKFKSNRLDIAQQIYRSNSDLAVNDLTDEALFILKSFEFERRRESYPKRPFIENFCHNLWESVRISFDWVSLKVTRGGTSLSLLSIYGFITWLMLTILLGLCNIRLGSSSSEVGFNPLHALSIFLGFGFTNFKACDILALVVLVFFAFLGIVWYSLFIPMLFRRIYR